MLNTVYPLFQSPVLQFRNQDHPEMLQVLLREIFELRAQSHGVTRSNQGGWHSNADFFRRTEPAMAALAKFVIHSLMECERRYAPAAYASPQANDGIRMGLEGWININPRHAFNAPHAHAGYGWSGCYYVQQPTVQEGRSGEIEFLDPRSGVDGWPMTNGELTMTKFRIRPDAGSLLIFPSYLRHWVYPNEQDEERISIAFNCRFQ
jgi:uncharacterized protein (TIGR02466 family)